MIEVQAKDFSKDHWSLLGYIESRVESNQVAPFTGRLDLVQMRVCPTLHPQFSTDHGRGPNGWKSEYGSRLQGFWVKGQPNNESKKILDHDDIHCIEDMEREGLVEFVSTANMFVKLTEKGIKVAAMLREHKLAGKNYADFQYGDPHPYGLSDRDMKVMKYYHQGKELSGFEGVHDKLCEVGFLDGDLELTTAGRNFIKEYQKWGSIEGFDMKVEANSK